MNQLNRIIHAIQHAAPHLANASHALGVALIKISDAHDALNEASNAIRAELNPQIDASD